MKKAVFTFGRMNPPTIGHEKLAKKIASVAKSEKADDARIYLSHTQNSRKDPLDYQTKIRLAAKAFGKSVQKSQSKTIFQIVQELEKAGYEEIVMVVGSDRVNEFQGLLDKYNNKEYKFQSIKVVSAGERDADAEGVEGMSASKMREAVVRADNPTAEWVDSKGNKQPSFKSGLPKKLQNDAQRIWDSLNRELKEEMENEALSIQQRLARGRVMKRNAKKIARMRKIKSKKRADQDTLKKRARKMAIQLVRKKVAGDRGSNYASLGSSEKMTIDKLVNKKKAQVDRMAKKLIQKVRKGESERLSKARSNKTEGVEMKDFKTLFEGAAQKKVRADIERERESDKQKHDRAMDRARTLDTQSKNRSEEKDTHKTKDGRTAKKGLWYNINKKKERGEKPNPKGHPDRPSAQDFKDSRKTTKEEVEQLEELTAAEKKLINQMYDKKGNLTPLGKKVMDQRNEESGAGEYGTTKLRKKYSKDTPMQEKRIPVNRDPKEAMMSKAIEALHRRAQSKGDKESIGGYAYDVARSFNGVSPKELEKAYKEKYK